MADPALTSAAAVIVAQASDAVRHRLAAIARSNGTYRAVLIRLLRNAITDGPQREPVAPEAVVTSSGELTEVGEEASRLAAAGLGDDAVRKVQEYNLLAEELGILDETSDSQA